MAPANDKGSRAAATGLDYGKRVSRRSG